MPYRIQVERIDFQQEPEPQWKNNVKGGDSAYVQPPEGVMRKVRETIYDQTMEKLDVHALATWVNHPDNHIA